MGKRKLEDMLTVQELQEELKKFGPWAIVYATEGKINLTDGDEGGALIGVIETPNGLDDT